MWQLVASTGLCLSLLATGASLLFSTHLKRFTGWWDTGCPPPPPPLFLHLWKRLVIWCRWFTASFMERLWENLLGLLVSDCLKEMWPVGSQLCPTGLVWEDCAWNWQMCFRVSSYPYLEKDPAGEKYFQIAESAGLGGWRIFRAPVHSLPLGKGSRFLPW